LIKDWLVFAAFRDD